MTIPTEARRHVCVRWDGRSVNGVRVDPVTPDRFLETITSFLDCGSAHVVHFLPADPTIRARDDPRYRAVLNHGDLNVPDGTSVAWALRLLGSSCSRLAGADAMRLLAGWGTRRGVGHYFYGGTAETVTGVGERFQTESPGTRIVGLESPPFRGLTSRDIEEAAERVRSAGADLLWIGLGTPKQDLVAHHLRDAGAAPVILCVGAAFDFVAGTKRRAPVWGQRAGLEWAFRLADEPRRLWRRYLIGNPRFLWAVGRDVWASRRSR